MNLFLDTNALVKLYHKEKGSERLFHFLESNSEELVLTISDLSLIEFHSTFLRRVRTGEIKKKAISQVFTLFKNDILQYNIIEIDLSIKELAIDLLDSIALERSLRTLDAMQLASAMYSNLTVPIDYFATSDKKFANVVKAFFQVLDAEE